MRLLMIFKGVKGLYASGVFKQNAQKSERIKVGMHFTQPTKKC
jgi:hypothetical protein